jgi:hypothetical protein
VAAGDAPGGLGPAADFGDRVQNFPVLALQRGFVTQRQAQVRGTDMDAVDPLVREDRVRVTCPQVVPCS